MKGFSIYLLLFVSFLSLYASDSNFIIFRIFVAVIILGVTLFSLNSKKTFKVLPITIFLISGIIINILIHQKIEGSVPVIFFYSSLILFPQASDFLFNQENPELPVKRSYISLIAFILLLFILQGNYDMTHRFSGFSNSATTFSTYLLAILTFVLYTERNKKIKILILSLGILFILFSQTRISLLLLGSILTIYYFRRYITVRLNKFFLLVVIASISFLPVVSIIDNIHSLDPTNRYKDNIDYSTYTRLIYFNNQVEALKLSSPLEMLIGHGINSSEKVGHRWKTHSIDQHNDFFLLIYNYGLIFLILFLLMLKRIMKNPLGLSLSLIYLFSFYHNMIYDVLLLFLIFVSPYFNLTERPTEKLNFSRT